MIKTLWITVIVLSIFAVTLFMPTVTTLPFGIDETGVLIFSSINALREINPFIDELWIRILLVASVYFLLVSWHFIKTVLDWIR